MGYQLDKFFWKLEIHALILLKVVPIRAGG